MNILSDLLAPAILAVASSLAYMSYRHPKGYRALVMPVVVFLVFWLMIILSWNLGGISYSIDKAKELMAAEGWDSNTESTKSISRLMKSATESKDTLIRYGAPVFLAIAYLCFLFAIPLFTKEEKEQEPKQESEEGKYK